MQLNEFLRDYGVLLTASTSLLASVIALFKESINSLFFKPKLHFKEADKNKFSIKNEHPSSEDDVKTTSYIYKLNVMNEGKAICKNTSLFLESILYKSNTDVKFSELLLQNLDSIKLNNKDSISITPYNRPISFELISIKNPSSSSETKGNDENKIIFKVGNNFISNNNFGGDYIINLTCYSESCKPKKIAIKLQWNGKWDDSFDEFLKHNVEVKLEV